MTLTLDFDAIPYDPPGEVAGATYEAEFDEQRLRGQKRRVWEVVKGGGWLTLREISERTGDPEASVSARLRELQQVARGSWTVEGRRRGDPHRGLWEYRLNELDRLTREEKAA